jgi:putative acetyltransferase
MTNDFESPEGIDIRLINESDIPGFRDCLDSVARERKYLAQLKAPPVERVAEFVMEALGRGEVRVVAVDSSRVVGWCDITPHHWEGLDHVGELGMGVLREYRRKGIGSSLLRAALDISQRAGIEKVELDVFASNKAAIELYENMGFVIEGRRLKSRHIDGEYDDIVEMGLFLQS